MNLDISQSVEAEQAVLGAILLDNSALDLVVGKLEPRDFTGVHALIWETMQYQYKNNRPCDFITLVNDSVKYGRLEDIGGTSYLSQLAGSCPTAANIEYYAGIVLNNSYRRRAYEVGERIKHMAEKGFEEAEQFFAAIEKQVMSIRPGDSGNMKHVSQSKQEYFEYLEQTEDCINTGFRSFDEWMGGIGRGWLYILAARPSVGKTAKALQMFRGIGQQDVGELLFWSQEMKRNQLFNRMLSPMSLIPAGRIRKKIQLSESEKKTLYNCYEELEKLPLHLEDAKNVTIEEVRATARQMKRRHGRIGAIIVDYLQIMDIKQQRGETRSQAVGYVTRTAKQIALEMDCPFIMLSQLSRDGKDEPKLEHLRDSGEIEQDADVVEFLWHNPEKTDPRGKVIQSIIAKGRDVGVNQFEYLFEGHIQRYSELR